MKRIEDLTGKVFGRWFVIKRGINRGRHPTWICKCVCGKINQIYSTHLRSGRSKGCRECNIVKHGYYGKPPYYSWRSMKRRCYDPNDKDYKYYGAKGIIVCDEWINNFGEFRMWAMANGFKKGLTIDRKNSLKNYNPNNCQWITGSENTKRRWRVAPCECGL